MGRQTKIWLLIGALLVVAGLVMFSAVFGEQNFDLTLLSTESYETNVYEVNDDFTNLSIHTDTADIIFVLSQDGKCRVECYEEEKTKHSVAVEGDKLTIRLVDNREWYDYIGIHIGSPKITVYLPKAEYTELFVNESTGDIELPQDFAFDNVEITTDTGDIDASASILGVMKIKTSTGDITIENMSAGSLDITVSTGLISVSDVACRGDMSIRVSTGKSNLTDVTCKRLVSSGSTGDIFLNRVRAEEKISIERSTGDVRFSDSDAAELYVETDTGDVTGNLLLAKSFITSTDTGSVSVPMSIPGCGRCEIRTDTGNIEITVPQRSEPILD